MTTQKQPIGAVLPSVNPGHYAIRAIDGPELVSGQKVEVLLGSRWIQGVVRYSSADTDGRIVGTELPNAPVINNHYIRLITGEAVGVCTGMRLRIVT